MGLDPALTLFPPRSSPSIHSPSPGELGAKCWCFHLPGGGRRERQPFGETPTWGSSENGAILPGQSHLPLPTRTHPWLWSSWYPSIENLKLDSITPSLGPLGPLSPHQSLFPMSEAPSDQKNPIGNSPLAFVEFIRPSVHLSIHPCHQFDHLAPLAGQVSHHQPGEPVRAAYALPLPHHIHPYEGA